MPDEADFAHRALSKQNTLFPSNPQPDKPKEWLILQFVPLNRNSVLQFNSLISIKKNNFTECRFQAERQVEKKPDTNRPWWGTLV